MASGVWVCNLVAGALAQRVTECARLRVELETTPCR